MKRISLTTILLIISSLAFSQKTIKISRDYPNSVTAEEYSVLETNNTIKHGLYTSKFHGKPFAFGYYRNGTRVGEWRFYNRQAKLVQIYNYNDTSLVYNDTVDMTFPRQRLSVKYNYKQPVLQTDSAKPPVKIGGADYSFMMLRRHNFLNYPKIPNDKKSYKVTFEELFTINNEGRLINQQNIVTVNGQTTTYPVNFSTIEPAHTLFVPATINKRPVESTISITRNEEYPLTHKVVYKVL